VVPFFRPSFFRKQPAMPTPSLAEALTLTPGADGALVARLTGGFSNAPMAMDPLKGAPFGGREREDGGAPPPRRAAP